MARFAAYSLAGLVGAATLAPAAPAVLPLTLPSGKVLQVEVMVKDEDRAMGLMFRPSLAPDRGMLFVFDALDFHGIWMKNCKFPIDIVWLDDQKKVVYVAGGRAALHAGALRRVQPLAPGGLRPGDRLGPGPPREGGGGRGRHLHASALAPSGACRLRPNNQATSTPSR